MKRSPCTSGRRSNFTLLELLILISIIAILASLLLPALKRARDKSYTTKCSGNLRQIASAAFNYANDSNDFLVPDGIFNRNGNTPGLMKNFWFVLLKPYLFHKTYRLWLSGNDETWNIPETLGGTIYGCPAKKASQQKAMTMRRDISYGINVTEAQRNLKYWFKLGQIPQSGKRIWFADGYPNLNAQAMAVSRDWRPTLVHESNWPDPDRTTAQWTPVNHGKANSAFLDGHTESLQYPAYIKNDYAIFYFTERN